MHLFPKIDGNTHQHFTIIVVTVIVYTMKHFSQKQKELYHSNVHYRAPSDRVIDHQNDF